MNQIPYALFAFVAFISVCNAAEPIKDSELTRKDRVIQLQNEIFNKQIEVIKILQEGSVGSIQVQQIRS